jgi:hypothetical protein
MRWAYSMHERDKNIYKISIRKLEEATLKTKAWMKG